MTYTVCDCCKQKTDTLQIEVEKEHPHNGSSFWVNEDWCLNCLGQHPEIKKQFKKSRKPPGKWRDVLGDSDPLENNYVYG